MRMISNDVRELIRQLAMAGWSDREIANGLGISRPTAGKYRKMKKARSRSGMPRSPIPQDLLGAGRGRADQGRGASRRGKGK